MKGKKLTYNHVKKEIEKFGYILLSKEYKNNNTKLDMKCPLGHEYKSSYNNFQIGNRCPVCNVKKRVDKQKHSYEFIKEEIEKNGYELLSKDYKHSHKKLKLRCSSNHEFYMNWNCFQQGQRCPICFPKFSKAEKEIVDYIKSFDIEINENDRSIIKNPITNYNLELDVFIPELNRAIEFNGKYWHKENIVKKRDKIKREQCKENGINLLVIEEQDWMNNKNRCLNKISEFIGV